MAVTHQNTVRHPVIDLILKRARSGSQPSHRSDGAKLGLVFEGGAMRGTISGGMGAGLEHLKLLSTFDTIYGASSGAFNAVFFVTNQAVYATSVYYEFLNNRRFIDFWRFFSRQPVVSLDHVLENVIVTNKVLDWKAVLQSPIPFKVVTSSVEKLKSRVLSDFTTRDSLFAALRATSSMPLVAGPPLELNGDRFLDASLFEAVPLQTALDDGCDHVLVLLTRPRGQRKRTSFFDRIIAKRLDKIKDGLGSCYLDSNKTYNETIDLIYNAADYPQGPHYISAISLPDDHPGVGRMEKRRDLLIEATKDGMSAAIRAFTSENLKMIETLMPCDSEGHLHKSPWEVEEAVKELGG